MFVDRVRIHAIAGDGGSGCCSFRREKFVPKGGPDGGDGGQGGDIILRADPHTDHLAALYYEPIIRAKKGANGSGANKTGRSAPPTIVKVPVGTLVFHLPELPTPTSVDEIDFDAPPEPKPRLSTKDLELIADLSTPGQEFVLCAGGKGGKGNAHFKSSTNRVPRQFTKGEPGEEGWFILELRTIADVGLVGYPNAGKSTLLGAISAAHPKVAPYPFTTLHPHVGVVEMREYKRFTVADIPGLIEGAHANVGLGHEFLRHIVRCPLLLHVVDAAGSEGRDPLEDLARVREELKLYDARLVKRPWLIAANKVDLPEAKENIKRLRQKFRRQKVVPISAEKGEGIEELITILEEELVKHTKEAIPDIAPEESL